MNSEVFKTDYVTVLDTSKRACTIKDSTQGRIQEFFKRGCTRLLLYFNTNKPHSFLFFSFCKIPVVLENHRSSQGGGGAHPLNPPPRSAPGTVCFCVNEQNVSKTAKCKRVFFCHALGQRRRAKKAGEQWKSKRAKNGGKREEESL